MRHPWAKEYKKLLEPTEGKIRAYALVSGGKVSLTTHWPCLVRKKTLPLPPNLQHGVLMPVLWSRQRIWRWKGRRGKDLKQMKDKQVVWMWQKWLIWECVHICAHMCLCMCVCVNVHMCDCACAYECICVCALCAHVCLCMCAHVCLCIHAYAWVCECVLSIMTLVAIFTKWRLFSK